MFGWSAHAAGEVGARVRRSRRSADSQREAYSIGTCGTHVALKNSQGTILTKSSQRSELQRVAHVRLILSLVCPQVLHNRRVCRHSRERPEMRRTFTLQQMQRVHAELKVVGLPKRNASWFDSRRRFQLLTYSMYSLKPSACCRITAMQRSVFEVLASAAVELAIAAICKSSRKLR